MKRKWLIALIAGLVIIPVVAFASFKGKLLKMGISSDYENISVDGDVTAGDDVISTDDVTVGDDLTVADDAAISGLATVGETLTVVGNEATSGTKTITGATYLRNTLEASTTTLSALTVTGNEATSGTKTVTGAAYLRSTLDVTSTSTLEAVTFKTYVVNSATSLTLTAADSGKLYTNLDAATTIGLVLPTAAKDLTFSFSDVEAGGGVDLWITAASGDTINGGTAAKSYVCTTDSVKHSVKLVAIDPTQWIVVEEVGTWANDNN